MTARIGRRSLGFNSLRHRLALLFFAITAGAILVVYFYVVPQLESSLTSEKLDGLKRDAASYSRPLQDAVGRDLVSGDELDRLTRGIAEQADAGVSLYGIPRNELDPGNSNAPPPPPYVISDSREVAARLDPASENVLEAAAKGHVTTATSSQEGKRLAQVAMPLFDRGRPAWVVVYSESLGDVTDNVTLIQRQILIAGAIALLAVLISGYYASNTIAKRVKRLERAAGEVAAGNFSAPIPIDSEDELGQLARAFNEMQRRLAGLDRARKEFIANASHELRTPIFSLGGFVELLQDEEMDEETRSEFLTTMREQIARLQKLAIDLLDLSRLDAGSLDLELEPIPLLSLANQVTREFAAAAAQQDATIEVVETGGELEARCDAQRTAQILRVLLDNALVHAGKGAHVTVGVTKGQPPDGPPKAQLSVRDDGPGIPRREQERIFDRFHSGSAGQGSGLGLAIARELAERMLGKLEVTSRPRETVFTVTLPLAGSGRPDRAPRPLAAQASTTGDRTAA